MYIESIDLENFRNYEKLTLYPDRGTTVIFGKNGSGKTNILEAVHFSCFGRSQRSKQDRDMMRLGVPYTAVQVRTMRRDGRHDVTLKMRYIGKLQKSVLVYGKRAERISDMFGHSTCVLFSPEDMEIIKGGPQERRRFIDMQLSQMRPRYLLELSDYMKALKNRNVLLKNASLGITVGDQFPIWEEILAQTGAKIVDQREWFLNRLQEIAEPIYRELSANPKEKFSIHYSTQLKQADMRVEMMNQTLDMNRSNDIRRQQTSFGPHRDDMDCRLNGYAMKEYASQGQMRTAVLAIKLAMIQMIEEEMGEKPVLLLDDVFSELDMRRRRALLKYIKDIQSIITCTDRSDVAGANVDCFIRVENLDGKAYVDIRRP